MIKINDEERELLYFYMEAVWEASNEHSMAMAGHALATAIDVMFTMKEMEHKKIEEQRKQILGEIKDYLT